MDKNEVYIQNVTGSDTLVHQLKDWCIEVLSLSLPVADKVKDPSKNVWLDEDGDDEYIPQKLYFQSYEMVWTLGCRALDEVTPKGHIRDFLDWLRVGGEKKIYIPHARYGRTGVRLSSFKQSVDIYDRPILVGGIERREHLMVFEIRLKVNDPMSEVSIENTDGVLNLVENEDE